MGGVRVDLRWMRGCRVGGGESGAEWGVGGSTGTCSSASHCEMSTRSKVQVLRLRSRV